MKQKLGVMIFFLCNEIPLFSSHLTLDLGDVEYIDTTILNWGVNCEN
jgi:hypothetical protein